MKRIVFIIAALLCTASALAQVTREVEVTKQYVPKLPPARKLDMVPDKQDTVNIRPEIDYTIAPKSFASVLTTNKFRPATVTYWEYKKRYPFYVKAGAGFPLVSELDVYASAERADVGYITGYVNHRGRFSKVNGEYLLADGGEPISFGDNNAQQMVNRIGINGGKYFGRYTLDGDVYYQSNMYHRYPQILSDDQIDIDEVNFENAAVKVSLGDSFADLSKLNFAIYAAADYYNDKSVQPVVLEQRRKLQQFSTVLGAKFARELPKGITAEASVDYKGYYGMKSLDNYSDNILSISAMVDWDIKSIFSAKAGLTYCYDHQPYAEEQKSNHIFPYLYAGADIFESGVFVPYVEVDGELINNSFQQLQLVNPYVAQLGTDISMLPNTSVYNVRLGIAGHTADNKLAYRVYGNGAFVNNSLFWYSPTPAYIDAVAARENIWSLVASFEYKPISQLYISAAAKGQVYNVKGELNVANCKPSMLGELNIRYTHRKFVVGASAELVGKRTWTVAESVVSYPTYVDLGLTLDLFLNRQCTLYIEGRNLANAQIYRWALYKEYGIGGLVGIKVQF